MEAEAEAAAEILSEVTEVAMDVTGVVVEVAEAVVEDMVDAVSESGYTDAVAALQEGLEPLGVPDTAGEDPAVLAGPGKLGWAAATLAETLQERDAQIILFLLVLAVFLIMAIFLAWSCLGEPISDLYAREKVVGAKPPARSARRLSVTSPRDESLAHMPDLDLNTR